VNLRTRFTERFGVLHPVLNAPMALVAGGALAAAVTRAGGLGLLGGGYAGTLGGEPSLAEEFTRAGDARIGVGFIGWALAQAPQRLDEALARRPACVFLSFADPSRFASRIHAAGVPLMCQVQNMADLRAAVAAGAGAVVAQGTEAGGHGGRRATLPFVPEAADYLARHAPDTLLLAAGGIADGRGLAAALMLGADAVVVGTRFWAAHEALTPEPAIVRALQSDGDRTVRTRALDALRGVPWPPAYSFRVVRNRLTDEWVGREAEAKLAFGSLREQYQRARLTGDLDVVPAVAGESIGLLHGRAPAAEIVAGMIDSACDLLTRPDPLDWRRHGP